MKLPPFDHTKQAWDRFQAFHTNHYPFVRFASGELIFVVKTPDPGYRKRWKEFNVTITMTTDANCPRLYLEPWVEGAKPTPKEYLTRAGGQYLLIDHDLNTATRLGYACNYTIDCPVRLRGEAAIYFAGEGLPARGIPTYMSQPSGYTPEQKEHISNRVAECQLWASMQDKDAGADAMKLLRNDMGWVEYKFALPRDDLLAFAKITDVPEATRHRVATYGTRASYHTTFVDKLYVRPDNGES